MTSTPVVQSKVQVQPAEITPLSQLHQHLMNGGQSPAWVNLFKARADTAAALASLQAKLPNELPAGDVSIIVSGSLGRGDFTSGSDIDWNLLLDGVADPQHFTLAKDIAAAVKDFADKRVGREGAFGGHIVSHDLIHRIGGEGDTNSNLTRRMLLLLETTSIGPSLAFDRTFKNVLNRYLIEDQGFWRGTTRLGHHVPHFLLNDLTRFWRTMTVDFAYKLRDRDGKGSVMRNLKLRMSRKILFAAGLLACFRCHLDFADPAEREAAYSPPNHQTRLLAHIQDILRLPPSDIIASVLLRHHHLDATATKLFNAYDVFLSLLANDSTRKHLENNDPPPGDPIRTKAFEAAREFSEALIDIFFDEPSGIGELTRRYGVF